MRRRHEAYLHLSLGRCIRGLPVLHPLLAAPSFCRAATPRLARRALEEMQGALVCGRPVAVRPERHESEGLKAWLRSGEQEQRR